MWKPRVLVHAGCFAGRAQYPAIQVSASRYCWGCKKAAHRDRFVVWHEVIAGDPTKSNNAARAALPGRPLHASVKFSRR